MPKFSLLISIIKSSIVSANFTIYFNYINVSLCVSVLIHIQLLNKNYWAPLNYTLDKKYFVVWPTVQVLRITCHDNAKLKGTMVTGHSLRRHLIQIENRIYSIGTIFKTVEALATFINGASLASTLCPGK